MNNASSEPFDFGEFSLRLLLSLLVGLTTTIVLTFLLFFLGFGITAYHVIFGAIPSLIVAVLHVKYRKQLLMTLTFIAVLIGVNSLWAKHIYGVNWDGMLIQKEVIIAFKKGWNPIQDPYFEQGVNTTEWENQVLLDKLTWSGFSTKFGYIYRAINASLWNNIEASKGINGLFLILPFLAAYYCFRSFDIDRFYVFTLSKLAALNPIILFQLFSFWEDIYFTSMASVSLLLSISFLKRVSVFSIAAWLLSLILLFGIKKSGVAFTGFLVVYTFLVLVLSVRRSLRFWIISLSSGAVALLLLVILGSQLGLWRTGDGLPFKIEYVFRVNELSYIIRNPELLRSMPIYNSLPGPLQFLANATSEASMVTQGYQFKWPFEVTQNEWSIYYNTFPGLWMGGFGPWFGFGLALIVCSSLGVIITARKVNGWVIAWALALWFLLFFQPAYFARWIGHIWLLPVVLVLATLHPSNGEIRSSIGFFNWSVVTRAYFWRQLSCLGLIVLLINSILLASLNLLGHANSSHILSQQLEFLESQNAEPISVAFNNFPSNRDWLEAQGIDYDPNDWQTLKDEGNYMVLHRTDTLISLDGLNLDKPMTVNGESWSSFYEWIGYLNFRSGSRDKWVQWVPLLYEPAKS